MPNEQPFPRDAASRQASHAGCTAHAVNDLETAALSMDTTEANRRPIKARGNPFIQRLARRMAEAGITPNSISVASVVFAALGAVCLLVSPVGWGAIACAVYHAALAYCANNPDGRFGKRSGWLQHHPSFFVHPFQSVC